jgi:hypothetical protein
MSGKPDQRATPTPATLQKQRTLAAEPPPISRSTSLKDKKKRPSSTSNGISPKSHSSLGRIPNMPNVVNPINDLMKVNFVKSLRNSTKSTPTHSKKTTPKVGNSIISIPATLSEDVTEETLIEAENYQGVPAWEFLRALEKKEKEHRTRTNTL